MLHFYGFKFTCIDAIPLYVLIIKDSIPIIVLLESEWMHWV